MAVRIKKNWNQRQAKRSLAQMANAISSSIWKLAANVVLNLENENFATDSQAQRLDMVEEIASYLVHIVDRWIYSRASQEQRSEFVACLVGDLARLLEDSRIDVQGPGHYRDAFVAKLNRRSTEYAAYSYSETESAGFALRCRFGDRVQAVMGERDQRWIPDFIVGREAPEIESALRRSLTGLVEFEGYQR